jgi:Family of unknown function (DUF5998)
MPNRGRRAPDPPHAAAHDTGGAGADRTSELIAAIAASGYHPEAVSEGTMSALGGEPVVAFVVHHEPTFDREEVRRHMTVAALTSSRVVVVHTDEHPADDLLPAPYTSTTSEAVPLSGIDSVVVTRMVAAEHTPATAFAPDGGVSEALLTIGWGAVRRIDIEPASCPDPACEADHGYTGALVGDDLTVRMSAAADGADRVDRLTRFSSALQRAAAV